MSSIKTRKTRRPSSKACVAPMHYCSLIHFGSAIQLAWIRKPASALDWCQPPDHIGSAVIKVCESFGGDAKVRVLLQGNKDDSGFLQIRK
jgi:hypothetical protein